MEAWIIDNEFSHLKLGQDHSTSARQLRIGEVHDALACVCMYVLVVVVILMSIVN